MGSYTHSASTPLRLFRAHTDFPFHHRVPSQAPMGAGIRLLFILLAFGLVLSARVPAKDRRRPVKAPSIYHYNGGALSVSSESLGIAQSSWIIEVKQSGLQKSLFDLYYSRHVVPAAQQVAAAS